LDRKVTGGSTFVGVILSVACQAAAFLVFGVLGALVHLSWFAFLWSIPQWCFVVPLFRSLKKRRNDRTARALLIASALGVVLNAGLLWLAFDALNNLQY
jgi:F0F1-type ATP synthase assembly protein I